MLFKSKQTDATLEFGRKLASLLSPGMVIALYGDLGSGKTVLSRGIARGLGVTSPVTSPTFTVAQEYTLPEQRYLYHLDMYRIDDENAALAFGIDEFLFAPNAITIVEWPERITGLLRPGQHLINIQMQHVNEKQRNLEIPDPIAQSLCRIGLPEGISVSSALKETLL
ncbi:MAG: tRNA (adenosine(37)-N6)-threonylcarbamoyltransferase complex ATPase subunit type 1 TsaE [Lentisphaeria bacterium]